MLTVRLPDILTSQNTQFQNWSPPPFSLLRSISSILNEETVVVGSLKSLPENYLLVPPAGGGRGGPAGCLPTIATLSRSPLYLPQYRPAPVPALIDISKVRERSAPHCATLRHQSACRQSAAGSQLQAVSCRLQGLQ